MSATLEIVIAGASGYIGKSLIPKLLEKFPNSNITALSRSDQNSNDTRVTWKSCDLFSLKSLDNSLPQKVDLAFYLVHSMGPTAQLDQGSFADYDIILADNFARILENRNASQLIYLSGLIPENQELSLHLQSRLEMEEIFYQYKIPTTVFRAGLIMGYGGSSFHILLKLVYRLPIMICPRWTQTLTTPVDLNTVVDSLTSSAFDKIHFNKTYDLTGCEPIKYIDMMKETAKILGLKRYFLTVPFFTPTLSRLWVSLITNSSRNLVYPLIESLEHPMIAREEHIYLNKKYTNSYSDLLKKIIKKNKEKTVTNRFKTKRKTVRSVQRFRLPEGKNAEWILKQYLNWLPIFLYSFLKITIEDRKVIFSLFTKKLKLLEMIINVEKSDGDHQLLTISQGALVSTNNVGRLEFRVVLNRQFILVAIHDYKPSLPWFIYKFTQAQLHLFVMNAFKKHLIAQNELAKVNSI